MTYKAEGREWMAVCAGSLDEPDRVVANMHVHGESMLRGFERPDPQVPFWNGKYRMVYGGNGKGEVEKTNAEILEMNASLMD
ncbi:hypothetical protein HK104_006176 [Borealophlyctis nickersoniae]|nr:hypothetical protein HK104_006176 [Borealophlyctis nickersoniae]